MSLYEKSCRRVCSAALGIDVRIIAVTLRLAAIYALRLALRARRPTLSEL